METVSLRAQTLAALSTAPMLMSTVGQKGRDRGSEPLRAACLLPAAFLFPRKCSTGWRTGHGSNASGHLSGLDFAGGDEGDAAGDGVTAHVRVNRY